MAHVFLPGRSVAPNKVLQTLAYGGIVHPIKGTYDDGVRFSEEHAEALGLFVCNSINPFRIEGQKSILFELAHSLNWQLPDWIVVPGGALSHATAIGKAVHELHAIGLIGTKPRIAVVQAEGAAPFYRMVSNSQDRLVPEPKPDTKATALNIGNPPSWRKALSYAVQGTGGVVLQVTDEEIMEAKRTIDRAGVGCEPASAAGLAGLKQLASRGLAGRSDTAVCVLTGHLLKDSDMLEALYGKELRRGPLPLTLDAVCRALA
ncbi:pyridoxal-phosphate dependent enzyme [Paenibacillus filicis]|uniref:Pyridoxal-phosphate dependent enzyme n=1 Tax=Paenibacillus gyeongsangnamensis TaxID=3388067 RepID=A0ABT4Q588_9BACL|nr:pyridoxal-phosphate dependent enzyme [Paenibacillus filicis]MCZ8512028.1 pyridoxal-phosphate dependent enzyme [Paenibacillus filicis]